MNIEKLKKYKELYDEGIITEEEYNEKRSIILKEAEEQKSNMKMSGSTQNEEKKETVSDLSNNTIKKGKKRRLIVQILIIIVVCGVGVLIYFWKFATPLLIGENETDAIKLLDEKNMKYEIKYEYTKKTKSGKVYNQSPDAYLPLFLEGKVILYISSGYNVNIPSGIIGEKQENAERKLLETSSDFKISTVLLYSDTYPAGTVIDLNYDEGNVVHSDAEIKMSISKGEHPSQTIIGTWKDLTGKMELSCLSNGSLTAYINDLFYTGTWVEYDDTYGVKIEDLLLAAVIVNDVLYLGDGDEISLTLNREL